MFQKITLRHVAEAVGAFLAVVAFFAWLSSREANVRAEALNAANEKLISQNEADRKQNAAETQALKAQLAQLQSDNAQIRADGARAQAQVNALFAATKTPQQAASLTDVLLALKAGTTVPGGTADKPTQTVPTAELGAYQQACESCKVERQSLNLQLSNLSSQLSNAGAQLSKAEVDKQILANDLLLRTQERDQWRNTAKGGTWLQRTLKVAAVTACAAAGAAAGYYGAKSAPGAAVGGGAGAVACSIAVK